MIAEHWSMCWSNSFIYIFNIFMEEKFLRSLQNLYFPSCQIKNEFAPAHMQFSGYILEPEQKTCSIPSSTWCSSARSCCNRCSQGHPGIKNILVAQDFESCAYGWWINSLLFSYRLVERNCEDRLNSYNNPLQKIYHHNWVFLGLAGCSRKSKVFWRTELMQDVKSSLDTEMLKCTFCLFLI